MKNLSKNLKRRIEKLMKNNPGLQDFDNFYSQTKTTTNYNVGWMCPICGSIYGPNTQECYRCNKNNITNNSSETLDKTIQERYL